MTMPLSYLQNSNLKQEAYLDRILSATFLYLNKELQSLYENMHVRNCKTKVSWNLSGVQ